MIVGILGSIGSGKNTVASHLVSDAGFKSDSFASALKDACSVIFGWPRDLLEGDTKESRDWRNCVDSWWAEKLGIEDFSPRLALQNVGTNVLRSHFHDDIWLLSFENRIRNVPGNYVISDVRFPNEIDFVRRQGGILIKVSRGDTPIWADTAILANNGNSIAQRIMSETYADIHYSEWAWMGSTADFEICNNGTLDELKNQVNSILQKITK
jgi:hypothetical protein